MGRILSPASAGPRRASGLHGDLGIAGSSAPREDTLRQSCASRVRQCRLARQPHPSRKAGREARRQLHDQSSRRGPFTLQKSESERSPRTSPRFRSGLVPAGASPAPRASRSWPTGSQGRRGLWMVMASLLARDAGAHHTPSQHTATQASQACCLGNQQPCQRMFSNEGPRSPGPGHQQGSGCDSTWVSSPPAKAAGNVLLVPRVWLTSPPL